MSTNVRYLPPMGIALQAAGYRKEPFTDGTPTTISPNKLRVQSLSEFAIIPQKGTSSSAGFDLYSAENAVIPHGTHKLIHTDIAMEIPEHHYGQIKSRSGLALKKRINVQAGTIDCDYRGEIGIILSNDSDSDFTINRGDRIAQMVIMELPQINIEVTDKLSATQRNQGGFGSTGINTINESKPTQLQHLSPTDVDDLLPTISTTQASPTKQTITCKHIDDDDFLPTCNVELSPDPFLDSETITLTLRGLHPTQGLILEESQLWDGRINITACEPGTAGRRIRNWIQRIKNSHLIAINNIDITSVDQATTIISHAVDNKIPTIKIKVSKLDRRSDIHEDEGVPMLYFDQLSTIATHLNSIKYDLPNLCSNTIPTISSPLQQPTKSEHDNTTTTKLRRSPRLQKSIIAKTRSTTKPGIIPKNRRIGNRLTRKKLKLQDDWQDWKDSEWKQLDQYEDQDTFGPPCDLPIGANVLDYYGLI